MSGLFLPQLRLLRPQGSVTPVFLVLIISLAFLSSTALSSSSSPSSSSSSGPSSSVSTASGDSEEDPRDAVKTATERAALPVKEHPELQRENEISAVSEKLTQSKKDTLGIKEADRSVVEPSDSLALAHVMEETKEKNPLQASEEKRHEKRRNDAMREFALVVQQEGDGVMPIVNDVDTLTPSVSAAEYSINDRDVDETNHHMNRDNAVDAAAEFGIEEIYSKEFPTTETETEGADAYSFVPSQLSNVELSELYQNFVRSIYNGNLSSTFELIKEGTLHGHGRLHWLLGVLHANGIGVPQSDAKAVLHYTFAALENVFEAHMALGRRYTDGLGVAKSCQDALEHYREAADVVVTNYEGMPNPTERFSKQFSADALKNGGHSNSKMVQMLMFRADEGSTDAIISLGYAYFKGIYGLRRNWHQARLYFLDALAKGDVAAYGALGRLYATGDSTAHPAIGRDLATAATYFSQGAEKKDAVSLNGMGYLHAIGFFSDGNSSAAKGRKPNFEKAAKFFAESVDRGSVEGTHNLGVLLLHGRGVPYDPAAAIKQFGLAAMRGNVLSIWQLARHEQRKGNCEQAMQLYSRVAGFDSIFDHTNEVPYFALSDGSSSSSSSSSLYSSSFASSAANIFPQLLEMLAMAETGHAASRYQVAQLLDKLPIIEETDDELEDGVFAKSGRPPERALRMESGVVWLQWYHNSMRPVPTGEASLIPLADARLLSQREALNMLRLRMYGLSALSGSAEANLRLGDFYYYGESQLVGVSMSRALLHYEAAAAKQDPKAYFNLGFMYQLGLGVSGRDQVSSVSDALYRIITNTLLEDETEGGGKSGSEANFSRTTSTKNVKDAVLAEEMRLYLAKRYYDRAMEFGSGGSGYAVKLALMTLNLQWWWLYFSHQQFGFSGMLRLPMPMARGGGGGDGGSGAENETEKASVAPELHEQQQKQQKRERQEHQGPKQLLSTGSGTLPDVVSHEWRWDDYTFAASATTLFLLLLLRHHVA
ncbi:hypothetical protein ECC02_000868 [Trypanosoma cruzi]|uniref:Uncharacterized protein n=1 Tax=Trypanosoma cruzi TaxID=5693 RepID=A0A7J6YH90_TRYCR|nr:hypothetical protein ECC02_000868 [Trypanosoma cruzi]